MDYFENGKTNIVQIKTISDQQITISDQQITIGGSKLGFPTSKLGFPTNIIKSVLVGNVFETSCYSKDAL
jgi:hypothetical protein